MNLPV